MTNYATTYTYDRRGRRKTAVRNGITTTGTYNDADQPLTETHSGGTLGGLAMNWTYDNALRRGVVTSKNGTNVLQAADYNYDIAGRLQTVADGSVSATYTYHPNSTLVATLALTNGPGTGSGLGVSRAYEQLNRLQNITSRAYGSAATNLPTSFAYLYNRANQRTRATLGDGTYWVYLYDNLGQVISGRRYWQDGTEVAGQQFEYRFDDIGNRGTTGGRVSAVSDYTANRLNQYATRTVPPYVEVMGIANPTTNVTVNGNVASRKGEYFHHALNLPNITNRYTTITVSSQHGAGQSRTGEVFVAASPEVYAYDADGNLTSDGRWTYLWDGENRLVEMKRDTSIPTLSSRLRLVFEYDHQGRRIRKYFYTHNGSAWVEQRDTICLYDGWNLVAELDANASKARLRTYVWGSDLSGTMEGAGGVGGLLWLNNYQTTYDGQTLPTGVHFVSYDGNGNVAALTKASDGSVSARYDYGPFGEPVRQTGALADAQPFRFSTKWTDAETGLLYYGYRFYNPITGRWISRDPSEENAGHNLLAFVNNDPLRAIDRLGRQIAPGIGDSPKPSGNGLKASRLLWSATPCGNNLRTSFIQVIVGAPRFLGKWIVDDGKHGVRSEKPTCPPLYPASHNNLYEDYPNVFGPLEDPLLYTSTFIVCRVCLEYCCWPGEERWHIVSVGPCASFAYPGGEEDVVDIADRVSNEVPWSFRLAVEEYYPSVLKGDCFPCQSSKL